ncbi:hypothetical protein GWI33_020016 [Rhynchophorus ferrugineus]|uniref:Uncharacterized protein n=1 Tax=Rhynchophorus ferrugineus TaxID=354439 RepID=A0A834M6D5_RHYFE|nr:hypothetical protein GWI33_020016 [Rhynchophorus ferrugineus]
MAEDTRNHSRKRLNSNNEPTINSGHTQLQQLHHLHNDNADEPNRKRICSLETLKFKITKREGQYENKTAVDDIRQQNIPCDKENIPRRRKNALALRGEEMDELMLKVNALSMDTEQTKEIYKSHI